MSGTPTWTELTGRDLTLVVPVGSYEQHGPHLPLDTDAVVAQYLAQRLCTGRSDFVLGPAVAYGASGEHEGFPGTVSIGAAALELLLLELGRSASRWARRLVLVNGHGGNVGALQAAVRRLRDEGRQVLGWTAAWREGDSHAGCSETSMMLALCPGAVRSEDAVAGRTEPVSALMPQLRAGGVAAVSPSGVLGDPAGASAEHGHRLLEQLLAGLLDGVVRQLTQ